MPAEKLKREIEADEEPSRDLKKSSLVSQKPVEEDEGMGEFEDAWEDEFESEDEGEVVVAADSDDEDPTDEIMLDEDEEEVQENVQVYLPGQELGESEELVPDNTAYDCLHQLNVEWPCLSFDVLRDGLGNDRKTVRSFFFCIEA